MVQTASIIMFFLSFFGLLSSRDIIKSIVCLVIKETSVVVFFLSLGHTRGILPPIGSNLVDYIDYIADPLPQALMITTIIIGLAVTAVDITMVMYLTRETNSTNWQEVKEKSMELLGGME